jgi:hypothetical protein
VVKINYFGRKEIIIETRTVFQFALKNTFPSRCGAIEGWNYCFAPLPRTGPFTIAMPSLMKKQA